MKNKQIDDMTLNDLQLTDWPAMIITDEVMMDLERRLQNDDSRRKRN